MYEVLIADMTKAYPNRLQDTLGRIATARRRFSLNEEQVYLVGREDYQLAQRQWPKSTWRTASEDEAVSAILLLAEELAKQDEAPDLVHVLSYNVDVLNRCGDAQSGSRLRFAASHFNSWTASELHFGGVSTTEEADTLATGDREGSMESSVEEDQDRTLPETRSQQIEAAIRKRGYGPYSAFRLDFYEQLKELLSSAEESLTVRQLVSGALERIQVDLDEGRYYWPDVRGAFIRALTEAGVLFTEDGSAVPRGPAGRLTVVQQMDKHLETKTDAELMMAAIEVLGDVCEYDYPALAGALYHQRTAEAEDRVAALLAHLMETGRIEEASTETGVCLQPRRSADGSSNIVGLARQAT